MTCHGEARLVPFGVGWTTRDETERSSGSMVPSVTFDDRSPTEVSVSD